MDNTSGRFKFKDLGRLKRRLGLEMDFDAQGGIYIRQRTYAIAVLRRYKMDQCNGRWTQLDANYFPPRSTDTIDPKRQTNYQSILGSINYIAIVSQPDLAYPVSMLGSYNANPSESHLKLIRQALRYIRETYDSEIVIAIPLSTDDGAEVTIYAEASFSADPDHAKSFSGYLLKVNGSTISWSSKQQSCVARSVRLNTWPRPTLPATWCGFDKLSRN